MTLKKSKIIAIDPDRDKSGVAIGEIEGDSVSIKDLRVERFFDLYSFLKKTQECEGIDLVIIEAGWLHEKANFRAMRSSPASEKIAKNVGQNHETGMKICEMCQFLGIRYIEVPPLKKVWGKSNNSKIGAKEFKELSKWEGKTNQEMRDAALILIQYRILLPMKKIMENATLNCRN